MYFPFVPQKHFATAAVLGGASYLVASAFRPSLRPILYGASFFSFSVVPYTLAVGECQIVFQQVHQVYGSLPTVMPINNEILKVTSDAAEPDGKGPDPGVVDRLFGEWRKYSYIRMSIAAAAWGLGTASLLLA